MIIKILAALAVLAVIAAATVVAEKGPHNFDFSDFGGRSK